ncbi:MAG TPA: lipid II flippase MurJ [Streptosporangiaceae bacterium]|nr:lipid II flippase MurJ [Streptosporangiaceae bacterium]
MTTRLRRRTGGVARAAVLIGVLTILARVAGFGRTVVFSQTVTKSCLSDAYFTANQIPNIIFEIVAGGALASMVVPVLAGPAERGDRELVRRTAAAMLTWTSVALLPLSLLAMIAAHPIMELLAGGGLGGCNRADFVAVGARMLVVFAPQILLYGLAIVLYGVLQAHRRFTGPALAPLVSSLVVIGAYVAYVPAMGGHDPTNLAGLPKEAELVLSVGTTLGVVALVVVAVLAAWPLGLGYRPSLRFPPGVAARVGGLAVAGLATVVAQQLAMLAVLVLKGQGTRGALTDYNFAWAVFLLPWAILAVPIATSAFPVLSARAAEGEHGAFDRTVASTTRAVVLVSGAGGAALMAVALPVADFLDHGRNDQPYVLARAIVTFAPGLIGYGLVAHLGRVLYACGRGRESAVATVTGWGVVLIADVVLVLLVPRDWVVAAFGVGNTLGMTVAGGLLLIALRRARGPASVGGMPRAAAAGLIGGILGGLSGYGAAAAMGTGGQVDDVAVALGAAALAGGVFVVLAYLIDGRDLRAVLTRRVAR